MGSIKANPTYRQGKASTIHDPETFAEFARRHSSCRLEQLAQAWQQETGIKTTI